ncbi:LicD family protein [Cellulomonas edaphi]|uniref:LicD family protein n=1 Tax=Cellulomonas edaphi TaxID=3053468 RepID=A0ABT7S421_9CELL|nr:hypothetical protein [Cellulomons edaphi]MDM7830368.1 hypothetical protein [Cellulomons edaphi]
MTDAIDARWDARTRATLFPSLGFYGAKVVDRVEVALPPDLVALRLQLPRTPQESLSVRLIELARGNALVKVPASAIVATASSIAKTRPQDPAAPLTGGTPLTTRKQAGPWWQVRFVEPVGATSLRLYNRRDGAGRRSRSMVVKARVGSPDAPWTTLWDLQDDDLAAAVAVVERLVGLRLRPPRWRRAQWAQRTRAAVLAHLVDAAGSGSIGTTSREDLRLLFALVPSSPRPDAPGLTEAESHLLAALLVAQRVAVPRTATSIRSFGDVLPDRAALRRLTDDVNRFAACAGLGPHAITRHGVSELGALQTDADGHLDLVERLSTEFAELGHPLVLAYGTLLGAVREGDFLKHDDDIDMLFRLDATDAAAAKPALDALKSQLRSRGYGIWSNPTGLNFHVIERATKRHVDVFPYLVDGELATLHMTSMRLETMALDVLEPHGRRELRGRDVPVPHRPEAFLEERYGSGWGVEDPYHDWTWPLSS